MNVEETFLDTMGTTFQAPYYGGHDFTPYSQYDTNRAAARNPRHPTSSHSISKTSSYTSQSTSDRSSTTASSSQHASTRATSPHPTQQPSSISNRRESRAKERAAYSLVCHSMQIPTCISPRGGSLADFTAQLTCFFWFETSANIEAAESTRAVPPHAVVPRLSRTALPTEKFKAWTQSILATTQVTQNVVLLALLFVHRLRCTVKRLSSNGGSEYRLLTVALMLANKFLDDNTYTNKTWAEVSNIPVQEVHIMEVEFLSNMRYGLLVSKEEWELWLVSLSKYHEFCGRASKMASPPISASVRRPSYTPSMPSPTAKSPNGHLVSHTATPITYNHSSPPYASEPYYSPPNLSLLPSSTAAWMGMQPEAAVNRKRSYDDTSIEPAPKRPYGAERRLSAIQSGPEARLEPGRGSVPRLTLGTPRTDLRLQTEADIGASHYPNHPITLALPPITTASRSMATVYPAPASTWAPNLPSMPAMPAMPTLTPSSASSSSAYPLFHANISSMHETPTKRLSPTHTLTPATAMYSSNSSPLSDRFPYNACLTPLSQSPSVYLQQRSSPYKPIRQVRTLLYPPPSASLQGYRMGGPTLPPTQMYYQPLGQRNEYRSGIVPEFRDHYLQHQDSKQSRHPAMEASHLTPSAYPH